MPKKPTSRVPDAVGSLPLVGDLARSADAQARWMQDLLEQNTRLVGQFPATVKSFNDSLERFNQTVTRLDRAVTRIEAAARNVTGPLERVTSALDPKALREIPETLDALRRETLPALRAASETQNRVAALQATLDRIVGVVADLPGAGMLRRATRTGESAADRPAKERPVKERPAREGRARPDGRSGSS